MSWEETLPARFTHPTQKTVVCVSATAPVCEDSRCRCAISVSPVATVKCPSILASGHVEAPVSCWKRVMALWMRSPTAQKPGSLGFQWRQFYAWQRACPSLGPAGLETEIPIHGPVFLSSRGSTPSFIAQLRSRRLSKLTLASEHTVNWRRLEQSPLYAVILVETANFINCRYALEGGSHL